MALSRSVGHQLRLNGLALEVGSRFAVTSKGTKMLGFWKVRFPVPPTANYARDRFGVRDIHSGPNRSERRAEARALRRNYFELPAERKDGRTPQLTRRGDRSRARLEVKRIEQARADERGVAMRPVVRNARG